MSAATQPLAPKQIETVLQAVTISALGLDAEADRYDEVRVGWPTVGMPASSVDEDVVVLRAVGEEDQINRQRDRVYRTISSVALEQDDTWVRVWRCYWVLYGPNSYDRARQIRSALYSDQFHDQLEGANLYAVMDFIEPRRLPEPFPGGQWIERVDFEACFDELVTEAVSPINTVDSVDVTIIEASLPDIPVPPVVPAVGRNLLLEDGGRMLTEAGGFLLLEQI